MTFQQVFERFALSAQSQATEALQLLLAAKHLYQSVSVDVGPVPFAGDDRPEVRSWAGKMVAFLEGHWTPVDPQDERLRSAAVSQATKFFYLTVPDLKFFCATCGRIEPFNLVSAEDFL